MPVEQVADFKIIGISMETTNENGKSVQDLGQLWGKFFADSISDKIPNKIDDGIFSLYTDYESDYTGKYTAIIGCKVSSIDSIPEEMIGREFEGGLYTKFTAKSLDPEAVVGVWKEVWAQDANLNRQYSVDFEVHKQGQPTEVFIAVKE